MGRLAKVVKINFEKLTHNTEQTNDRVTPVFKSELWPPLTGPLTQVNPASFDQSEDVICFAVWVRFCGVHTGVNVIIRLKFSAKERHWTCK